MVTDISFLSNFIILCAFFHGCVISDNIIKDDRKSVNWNFVYIEYGANLLKSNECHGIIRCLIKKTSLNRKNVLNHIEEGNPTKPDANVPYPTGSYNLRTRSKRNTHERLFDYGSFYEEYPRYEGIGNRRPWPVHRAGPPHERPDYYEETHNYRENEPNARSLRRPPYGRPSYDEGFSHHIEPRSSLFGNKWPDGERPWPQSHGDPPYDEPPAPKRETFLQRPPPPPHGPPPHGPPPDGPPPDGPPPHGPPLHGPPPHGPPPHEHPPYRPPPRGFGSHEPPSFPGPTYGEPPQNRPMSERQFQPESPPPRWEAPRNWKPPSRDLNNPSYLELAQFKDTSNIPTIVSDIDINKNQENTTDSDVNSFMYTNNKNLDMASVNNYENSTKTTRPHVYLFQAEPVTPEE